MKIALTFDDGPHPRYTPQILDVLDEYKIKATFFMVGVNAKNYPDALTDVVKKGHEIGNHTYTHPHVSHLNTSTLTDEVEMCESTIFGLTDYKTKLFRPPEGMIDADVRTVLRSLDYKVIMWDIDTRDWAHESPEKIAENVISNITSGDIILMHDYIGHNSPTIEAIKLFIPVLIEKGYKFVVVSELIGLE
jgi:peptidoglycan/xylan/chitin deacetylase (PgdA/CDA1 family)